MGKFQLLAQPPWVNLLMFIPVAVFIGWRRRGLQISGRQFLFSTLFALALGFVEAAVVVYLRAASGLLPGYAGTLTEVQCLGRGTALYPPTITQFPQSLLTVEVLREGATILMLVSIALLAAARARERWGPLSVDICLVGYHLLCQPLGDHPLANFAHRPRRPVSDPSTGDGTGVVPTARERPYSNRCGIEPKTSAGLSGRAFERKRLGFAIDPIRRSFVIAVFLPPTAPNSATWCRGVGRRPLFSFAAHISVEL